MTAREVRVELEGVGLTVTQDGENLCAFGGGLEVTAARGSAGWVVRTAFDRGEVHRDGDEIAPRRLHKQLVRYLQSMPRVFA